MREGDIVLLPIPQADGKAKNRPALILRQMPPYGDLLVCGISSQLHKEVPAFDELITTRQADFSQSGLLVDSVIRLGFLAVVPRKSVPGNIGSVSSERHKRLLMKLSAYLVDDVK